MDRNAMMDGLKKHSKNGTDHNNNVGTISFASYFRDHMVLQGEPHKSVIWGYASNGSIGLKVTIAIENSTDVYATRVNTNLTWKQLIGPVKSGGPYIITARLEGGNQSVVLKDVLFGDVWVCSGQSNMHFSINKVFNASFEMKDGLNYPDVRLFVVNYALSKVPLTDFSRNGILLPWSLPSPVTLGGGSYFSAVCWLYGKYLYQHLKKPLGLVAAAYINSPIEAWSSSEALSKCGLSSGQRDKRGKVNESSVLWNAMVSPLTHMSILGAIWYQGEANIGKNRNIYQCTFPAMIDDWREKFNANSGSSKMFPFGFVQLAGKGAASYRADKRTPMIRLHQTADYGYVPNDRQRQVFMAVAMDLQDFLSPFRPIHPRYKQDVAARLVLGGLNVAYGYDVSFQGPRVVSATCIVQSPGNYPLLTLEYSMDIKQKWLDGFEICCAFSTPPRCQPGKAWWIPTATALEMHKGKITTLHAMMCNLDNIVGLRYAWRDTPCTFQNCAIYGADNDLPMPPFISTFDVDGKKYVSKRSFVIKMLQQRNSLNVLI